MIPNRVSHRPIHMQLQQQRPQVRPASFRESIARVALLLRRRGHRAGRCPSFILRHSWSSFFSSSFPVRVERSRLALALSSFPSTTPSTPRPLVRTRQTCLFLRLAMGCRDLAREEKAASKQLPARGCAYRRGLCSPKYRRHLSPHEVFLSFSRHRVRVLAARTGDRPIQPRLGGKLYALD